MNSLTPSSIFKKPNSALVMVPKVGKLTAITRKVFNVMLQVTQRQVTELAAGGQVVQATHRFKARLSDLVIPIENGDSNLITYVKHSLREMRRVELDWEAPDANSEVIWTNMSLLSEVRITKEKKDNVLYAEWALPPGLMEVIADPARFTPIDIAQLAQLRTYTTVALYEICSRYRNNPSGVTSEQNMEWWIGALSQSPLPIDPTTKLPKPRNWSKFKDDQLNSAMEEINGKSDLIVELLEKKTGRKLTSAQFRVARKPASIPEKFRGPKIGSAVVEAVAALGLSLSEVSNLLKQGYSEGVVKAALSRLGARVARTDLPPVEANLAYLRSVLVEARAFGDNKPQGTKESVAALSNEFLPAPSYRERRRAAMKEELISLDRGRQRRYAAMAFEKLQQVGMASPEMAKKLTAGDWSSGLLLTKMIDTYAIETYGSNWGVDPFRKIA